MTYKILKFDLDHWMCPKVVHCASKRRDSSALFDICLKIHRDGWIQTSLSSNKIEVSVRCNSSSIALVKDAIVLSHIKLPFMCVRYFCVLLWSEILFLRPM